MWIFILNLAFFAHHTLCEGESNIDKRSSKTSVEKLRDHFLSDPLQLWLYKDMFSSFPSLGIHYGNVNRSIHVPNPTPTRLRNLFYRALNGHDIQVAVLGGSISAGATLFRKKNDDKIYFYALQDYWNKIVKPITGSEMKVQNLAIGAVGSDFYSYCLENYVNTNDTDLIIWEMSSNDYHRFDNRDVPPTLPLELLTRRVLDLQKHPAMIHAHFFRGKDYKHERGCNNLENNGAGYVAKYYGIPSISWKTLTCRKLILTENESFGKMFGSDLSHPTVLGHAHMGFLLIHVMRKLFLRIIDDVLLSNLFDSSTSIKFTELKNEAIPKSIFLKSQLVSSDAICFTFNIPSSGSKPHNKRRVLRVIRNDGYIISTAHGFLTRKDKNQGLRSKLSDRELHLQIDVPTHKDNEKKQWMILIGTYSNFGGAVFYLDGVFSRIIETEKYAYGSIVAAVATKVGPGKHKLVMKSLPGGFFLSSVMLG